MTRKHNGYTMTVTKNDEGRYDILVVTPRGNKIFDWSFSQAHAWKVAHKHAGI